MQLHVGRLEGPFGRGSSTLMATSDLLQCDMPTLVPYSASLASSCMLVVSLAWYSRILIARWQLIRLDHSSSAPHSARLAGTKSHFHEFQFLPNPQLCQLHWPHLQNSAQSCRGWESKWNTKSQIIEHEIIAHSHLFVQRL